MSADQMEVVERLLDAMNAHDLEALLGCFDRGCRSEQPAHSQRGFGGREQVETYVWPARGTRERPSYGRVLGSSTFRVPG